MLSLFGLFCLNLYYFITKTFLFILILETSKMSVHYKFKSTLHFDTITFDGLHISVADLKKEIVQQKRLGKIIDFDLQITNAQNKEGK